MQMAALGPELPFTAAPDVALQRHRTGHSCVPQHFRRVKVGRADKATGVFGQLIVSF